MKYFFTFLINLYRLTLKPVLKSLFGEFCRFSPSCSAYAITIISQKGAIKGSFLAIARLLKCHPYSSI